MHPKSIPTTHPTSSRFGAATTQASDVGSSPHNVTVIHGGIAPILLSRLRRAGTFARPEIPPSGERRRPKRDPDAPRDEMWASEKLVLHAFVTDEEAEWAPLEGLVIIRRSPEQIFKWLGYSTSCGYEALKRLCGRGLIREMTENQQGRSRTVYVVPMPPEPAPTCQPPEEVPELFAALEREGRSSPLDHARGAMDPRSSGMEHGQEPTRPELGGESSGLDPVLGGLERRSGGPDRARRGLDPRSNPLDHSTPTCRHDDVDETCHVGTAREEMSGGSGGRDVAQLRAVLESIEIEGRRLDPGGINVLLTSPHCTLQNIRRAVETTRAQTSKNRKQGKPIDAMRYVFRLIQRGCTPPPTKDEGVPEHRQEEIAVHRQRQAAEKAKFQQLRRDLDAAGPEALRQRIRMQIQIEQSETIRRFWERKASASSAAKFPDWCLEPLWYGRASARSVDLK